MAKRMLIDATHPEETRVVVISGNRLEEFDFESSTKKQLKGNIYLAKVTRVEPSLQAAFVDYGGNRHGFLAFNEIHPDYWRIPIADREALLAEQSAQDRYEDQRLDDNGLNGGPAPEPAAAPEAAPEDEVSAPTGPGEPVAAGGDSLEPPFAAPAASEPAPAEADEPSGEMPLEHRWSTVDAAPQEPLETPGEPDPGAAPSAAAPQEAEADMPTEATPGVEAADGAAASAEPPVSIESVGGDDDMDEVETRRRFKPMRHYKIQEVIKRRQVLLVQVVKEERGTKGAALTTYLSLAGRYCVLMPNTARGGGISRRITSAQDRKRLKSIMEELQVPDGMAVILRTAGMERNKAEIKRDYEYLLRQWDDIRELTLKSTAPALVYEEGNLIKRAIRDLYSRDIEEILVEGDEGHKTAKAFMRMLMPSHVGRIQLYNDPAVPLLQRFQVEAQLDEMHGPTVRLKSGGYIVINPTEALVSIDVNSGRATRERHIEETAFKTNLEAADEIARQLRLRDLAGLIVIDFIDMEENRNQHAVERRLKEAMKSDRARIQIGRISPFGLLELSRQRLRPSLLEVSSERCPHCAGTGFVRSTESTALHVLRAIEEEGMKLRTAEAVCHVPTSVALYMLNHKREALASIEQRFGLDVAFNRDDALIPPAYRLERVRARTAADALPAPLPAVPAPITDRFDEPAEAPPVEAEPIETPSDAMADEIAPAERSAGAREPREAEGDDDGRYRRRRRRRRGRGRTDEREGAPGPRPERMPAPAAGPAESMPAASGGADSDDALIAEDGGQPAGTVAEPSDGDGRRRRRGRRGGRRRGRHGPEGQRPPAPADDAFAEPPYREPMAATPAPQAGPAAPAPERPRRIEGPGDAYDWPWNRRAERFPEEQEEQRESPAALAPAPADEPRDRPAPAAERPAPEPVIVRERAPEPPRAAEPTPEPEPETSAATQAPEAPSGPPRRGWWRRITS